MPNFLKNNQSPLEYVTIKVDDQSHINIKDQKKCLNQCENKPCTYYCPTRVFSWDEQSNKIRVDYSRCIECLACPFGCPLNNIDWNFPRGSYGVIYQPNGQ
ncbi:4Fe-4S dicluster domain-containing protein [Natroniella acetigena]|uniref:ferredoxin family protein n=1 Tax=Natroniella acetigena TaxID=52004 RepID=UPI00200A7B8E|nr:4Fe-4S dicluster domain-containing protein [Natroniella acetigena]MCK8827803.1 4Fe-4S dicluster domain-containing protein [Natroniella acetigena]